MLRKKLLTLLAVLMVSQLSFIGVGVAECIVFVKKHPDKVRPQCQKIDETLQTAVNQYVALILALLVPTSTEPR